MGRRKNSGMEVNLFPFLSILVAIIGCLTLIIVVMALSQSDQKEDQTPEEVLRVEEWKKLKKEREEKKKELDDLRINLEALIQRNRDTITKHEKLQKLKEMKDSQEEIDETRNELIAKINALDAAIKGLDTELPVIEKKIEDVLKELAERDLPPEPPKLRVRPSGSGTNRFPFFVEAANQSVLIHQSLTEPPVAVPLGSIDQNKDFNKLLETVAKNTDKNRLIFLVRGTKASTASYSKAADTVVAYNKDNGKLIIPGRLPLPADGEVDLQPFAKFLRP